MKIVIFLGDDGWFWARFTGASVIDKPGVFEARTAYHSREDRLSPAQVVEYIHRTFPDARTVWEGSDDDSGG